MSILPYSSVRVLGRQSSCGGWTAGGAKKWIPELKLEAAVAGPTVNWIPEPTLDGVAHVRAVKWIPDRKLDDAEEFLDRGGIGVTSKSSQQALSIVQ